MGPIIYASAKMSAVIELAKRLAQEDDPVLIRGETGTGKGLLAEWMHEWSPRRALPFCAVNCSALSDTLGESELFGHVRGAFTGAERDRMGHLRETGRGTLFLDEVGDAPLPVQAALLKAIEGGEVYAIGEDHPYRFEGRLLSATNHDLEALSKVGKFREDFFYRISDRVIEIPPLRERPEDVLAIAEYVLADLQANGRAAGKSIGIDARRVLISSPWWGNVRQLIKTVRSAALIGSSMDLSEIGAIIRSDPAGRRSSVEKWALTCLGRGPTDLEIQVLLLIEQHGPIARAVVARELGQSEGVIRRVVSGLLAAGLLVQGGRGRAARINIKPDGGDRNAH
jgi:transcriptional regulator with GAF, ATPase, and Fis domain